MLISFYGAPGCGKSTIALGFTSFLKTQGKNAEYVGEYVKNLIAEHGETHTPIYNQLDILVNQNKLLRTFYDTCDYVITDGGLRNTTAYLPFSNDPQINFCQTEIEKLCWCLSYYYRDSINILVEPCSDAVLYKDSLRNLTFDESAKLHENIFTKLVDYDHVVKDFFKQGINYTELLQLIEK